jgi:macrolide-specific efflux system membrane fusion protein
VVTQQDAKVGQIVSANTVVMRLISDAKFTIETYVPEINIKEVQVGNIAKVTLDAYGDDQIFDAKVVSIDPGETIRDGVSTYKVLFEFVTEDSRLKSGMTANVVITTETKQGALLIPQEAIIRRNGFSYVNVMVGKQKVEKQVTTGSTASNGYIEIVSGLSEGEVVIKNAQ